MSKIYTFLTTCLAFTLLTVYLRKWRNGFSVENIESNNITSVDTSKVTMRRLVSLLAENAATPPIIPVNSSCVPDPQKYLKFNTLSKKSVLLRGNCMEDHFP